MYSSRKGWRWRGKIEKQRDSLHEGSQGQNDRRRKTRGVGHFERQRPLTPLVLLSRARPSPLVLSRDSVNKTCSLTVWGAAWSSTVYRTTGSSYEPSNDASGKHTGDTQKAGAATKTAKCLVNCPAIKHDLV